MKQRTKLLPPGMSEAQHTALRAQLGAPAQRAALARRLAAMPIGEATSLAVAMLAYVAALDSHDLARCEAATADLLTALGVDEIG